MQTPANGIDCPRCGWRNAADARMCGGCGQPLPLPPRSAPLSDSPYDRTVTLPGAPGYASPLDDMPTLAPGHGGLYPPPDVPPHPAYRPGAAPGWPIETRTEQAPRAPYAPAPYGASRAAPATRRGNCLVRALVTLLVLVLVLGCCTVGTWALVIRPPLHAQVDRGIRSTLGAVVDGANTALARIPPGQGGSAQIPAAQINDQIQSNLPANSPFRDVSLDFANSGVMVRYTINGSPGALFAGLAAQGGRLVAPTASVTGPLALVESSSELLNAVRDELAGLTNSVAVTDVGTSDHTLNVTVKANGG